jgi:predicted alpha/beta hydrolase family esterase
MPLVFVHGVNTRRGVKIEEQRLFDDRVELLKQQFRNVAFADRVTAADGLKVFAPYWGNLGVTFARNLASLPQSGVQALGIAQPTLVGLVEAMAGKLDGDIVQKPELRSAPLVTVAKTRSLGAAVDLLFAAAAQAPKPGVIAGAMTAALPDVARFAAAAEHYAAANPKPAWLAQTQDDDAFLTQLYQAVTAHAAENAGALPAGAAPKVQSLGIGSDVLSWLKNGATAAKNAVSTVVDNVKGALGGAATSTARAAFLELSGFVRPAASAFVGRFFGDVFSYLENRQQVIERVLADVDAADRARREGDQELYLLGHSFGGIILYDILTKFQPQLQCQLYVTVGSQVALFAEIDRLAAKQEIEAAFNQSPTAVVPRPKAAERWVNIFDLTDFVGFGTRGVFGGVSEYQFATDALPLISHVAYFDTPRFFARLRERVNEAFKSGTDAPGV